MHMKCGMEKLKQQKMNEELNGLQSAINLEISGCYRTTSNEKLLNPLKMVKLSEELTILMSTSEVNKDSRKESYGNYNDIDLTSSRYLLWCITRHDPSRAYLKKFRIVEKFSMKMNFVDIVECILKLYITCAVNVIVAV